MSTTLHTSELRQLTAAACTAICSVAKTVRDCRATADAFNQVMKMVDSLPRGSADYASVSARIVNGARYATAGHYGAAAYELMLAGDQLRSIFKNRDRWS